MAVLIVLILASLGMALAFLFGFMWAVNSGQFEDTVTPSMRILTEEENPLRITNHRSQIKKP
jgi:cbb3-type cytochrome oxidase maturation protein